MKRDVPVSARTAWLTLVALALAGCGGDPEPTPEPAPEPTPVGPGPEPAPAQPTPPPTYQTEPPARPAEPAQQEPRRVVVTARAFAAEVMDQVRVDDRVEVELARGGRTQGVVKNIKSSELTLAIDGSQVITRLKPDDVRAVRVTFRDTDRITGPVSGDEPRNDQERWLDRWADRAILDGRPGELWTRRFGGNVSLTVKRAFSLAAWLPQGRRGTAMAYSTAPQRASLREGDQVKIVGTSLGLETRPGSQDRPLGELTLYLLKRGDAIELVCSTDAIHPSNLERAHVLAWLEQEPVTFAAFRPENRRYVYIGRLKSQLAARYVRALEATPERPAIRAWRAQRNPDLEKAEKAIKDLYAAVRLTTEADLEQPLSFEVRVPSTTGGLRLVAFRKELGVD